MVFISQIRRVRFFFLSLPLSHHILFCFFGFVFVLLLVYSIILFFECVHLTCLLIVYREMTDWMRTINAHIHVTFCTEENILYPTHQDYWDAGQVVVSFWRVPIAMSRVGKGGVAKASMQRRPVGIRTLPFVHGPRTGEGLFPGDIVEIVQTINESQRDSISLDFETKTRTTTFDSSEQQQYLRLAGDRGWVFENHPTV